MLTLVGCAAAPMAPDSHAALVPALDNAVAKIPKDLVRKLQLIHIPKTGGGTLEDVGKKHGVKWGKYRDTWPGGSCPRGCPGTWQPCSSWHIPPPVFKYLNADEDPYEGYHTFCAVRHPFSRAISEYLWSGGECSADGLNSAIHAVLRNINQSIHTLVTEFPKFSATDLAIAARAQYPGAGRPHDPDSDSTSDCHWLPQWLYTKDSCDTILRTESLMDDFKAMMHLWGHQINVSDMETATFSHSSAKRAHCELEVGALDDLSRDMLTQVYHMDFKHFGYATDVQGTAKASDLGSEKRSSLQQRASPPTTSTSSHISDRVHSRHSDVWLRKHANDGDDGDGDSTRTSRTASNSTSDGLSSHRHSSRGPAAASTELWSSLIFVRESDVVRSNES